ncbi:septum formation initiator family protein [Brevibacillus fluminis]|uniref:Septum formation initiator family protein n=1 Tax=Brevibacillus fluminis TaxID=511487 RepID=A0A3M8D4J8_9BACL|nr:septum formation initiator family protein [Brevibacillus fluminis]RNB82763.1 septum formation initiator family protein [Brevibacillus fluminis]
MSKNQAPANNKGQKRRMRIFMFFVLLFSIWTGYTAYLQSGLLTEKEEQLKQLQAASVAEQKLQAELAYKANRLNDKEYLAELARKQWYLTKPGEIIYILPEQK